MKGSSRVGYAFADLYLWTDRRTVRRTDRQTDRQADRPTDSQTDSQTDRHDGQADRKADRWTGRRHWASLEMVAGAIGLARRTSEVERSVRTKNLKSAAAQVW